MSSNNRTYRPLVSIVIPVYNGSNYMREAIDSAIQQSYENIEIIVVNDGSTDGGETDRIAKSYGDKIKYFYKENGGCASALNYGISKMNGEWFSWLSHDDSYSTEKINRSIEVITENDLTDGNTIVYCNSDLINEEGEKIFHPVPFRKENHYDSEALFETLLFDASLNGCALLIHKNVINAVGSFDEDLVYIPDFDYWIRIAEKGFSLYAFDEILCSNRVHEKQVSVTARGRRRTDIDADLVKISNILCESSNKHKDKMIQMLWIYAYARRYKNGLKAIERIARDNRIISPEVRFIGFKNRITFGITSVIKYIYKGIFKKGMD